MGIAALLLIFNDERQVNKPMIKARAEVGDGSKDKALVHSNIYNECFCCLTQNNYCHISVGLLAL